MKLSSCLTIILASCPAGSAFLFQYKPVEGLASIAEQVQQGTHLDINLSVGENAKAPQLHLTGLKLDLSSELETSKKLALPGAHGPNKSLSSGARHVEVSQMPSFISLEGQQSVELKDGCWEIVWKDELPSGHLICGFNIPTSAKRNKACLPAGNLILSIPLWTQEGLAAEQVRKFEIEALARKHLEERDEELKKMQECDNILKKAWHYRNAAEAVEKYYISSPKSVDHIPVDDDGITIPGGIVLAKKGAAWTKRGVQKIRVGDITLRAPVTDEEHGI